MSIPPTEAAYGQSVPFIRINNKDLESIPEDLPSPTRPMTGSHNNRLRVNDVIFQAPSEYLSRGLEEPSSSTPVRNRSIRIKNNNDQEQPKDIVKRALKTTVADLRNKDKELNFYKV